MFGSGGLGRWLNPHLHLVALDGAWYEQDGELCWQGLGHLKTSEVGSVLESTVMRTLRHLRRRGLLRIDEEAPIQAFLAIPRATSPPRPSRARRHPPGRSG